MGEDFRKIRVLNTFTLQRIVDSEDVEGRLEMQGSFVQTALDLTKEEAEEFCNRENDTAFFSYRFDQQVAPEESVKVRRIDLEEVSEVDEDGNPKLDENGRNIIACYGCRTTMKVRVPLKVELVASAFPFEVSRLDATIELRSTVLNGERVRGDLLLHESDPRHTVCMGLGLGLDGLLKNYGFQIAKSRSKLQTILDDIDKTKEYSLISPYPEVCYTNFDTRRINYCPRFKLTFFAVNAGFQRLVGIVLPMVLVTFLATLNVINDIKLSCDDESGGDCEKGEEVTNHLQVTSALTLTIIFVLPQVVDSNSYRVKFKLMTREAISVMVFFFSLVLASVPRRISVGGSASTEIVGVILMALSTFLVPLHNFYIYFGFRNNIYNKAKRSTRINQFLLNDTHRKWKGLDGLRGLFTLDEFFRNEITPRKKLYTVFYGFKDDSCLWWDKNFEPKRQKRHHKRNSFSL